jgi:hypothetical protein
MQTDFRYFPEKYVLCYGKYSYSMSVQLQFNSYGTYPSVHVIQVTHKFFVLTGLDNITV